MSKKKKQEKFIDYQNSLNQDEQQRLNTFFHELDLRLFVSAKDKKELKSDFEKALMAHQKMGISFEESINLLDLSNLGGFYSRSSDLWIPLDEVAKSYTEWVDRYFMPVFRLAANLKEEVVPELLQMALNFTVKRFPYFTMSIKQGVFWHYLDSSRRRYTIEKEDSLPVQRIRLSLSGSKAFRVLYYKNRISVEFFHCMCDGTGAKEFLKTLLVTYFRLLNKDIKKSRLIFENNGKVDNKEYENAYLNIERTNKVNGYVEKKALQLSGKLTREKPCRVLHFKMPTNQLVSASKKHGVSVTAFVSSMIFNACKSSIDDLSGTVDVSVPVNMRKCYPSKTLRNFSLVCHLRKDINEINNSQDFIEEIGNLLKDKANKDRMLEMMASTKGMVHNIRLIPLIFKRPINKLLYKFFGDRITTTSLSNLGIIELPDDVANEIEDMEFVLGTAETNRAVESLITVNNVSTLSISKLTCDPSFEESLYSLLTEEGIKIDVEGSDIYAN